jgi:hypothetical protein
VVDNGKNGRALLSQQSLGNIALTKGKKSLIIFLYKFLTLLRYTKKIGMVKEN